MASISKDPGGRRRILFKGADGKRRTVRLGKVSQESALTVKVRIERLVSCQFTTAAWDNDLADWVVKLTDEMAERLAAVGLIPRRLEQTHVELADFIDGYVSKRTDVKESTATVYGHTRRCLVAFFGKNKLLRDVTAGDADEWRTWLQSKEKLSENTIRRRCGIAKQFFRAAIRRKIIRENPFADMKAVSVKGNASRFYFVTEADSQKVLEACPDLEWRLMFALSRYGGLRCPSEHLALRWEDIDWERDRITVRSPKTERHDGKESRVIPMFPELRPLLADALDQWGEKTPFVIFRYRDAKKNFRTRFEKIIKRAGLKPWPKLFQNLRSTRQTELCEKYPSHVVCNWIGNSRPIASEHYLQTTDEHFAKAIIPSEQAAQNPAQQAGEIACMRGNKELASVKNSRENTGMHFDAEKKVGSEGLEPPTLSV